MNHLKNDMHLTDFESLKQRIEAIKPLDYIRTRNYLDGSVSGLSPYITHGVISVANLAEVALIKHEPGEIEKFLFQLAWREFFHRVWEARKDEIFSDLRQVQPLAQNDSLSTSIITANTGIEVLDRATRQLTETGWIHNHARMWTASVVCNIARTRWQTGARWMYYHLLDGDLASNSLSWQWVAGSFSNKTYIANQDNLNKFSRSTQRGTFLDTDYTTLAELGVPEVLSDRTSLSFENNFPEPGRGSTIQSGDTVFLYHPFSLDSRWRAGEPGHRVLLIEPDRYQDWPLGPHRWTFVRHWARQIKDLWIHDGTVESLLGDSKDLRVVSRRYPLFDDWPGERDERNWLFPETSGYYPSFFKFWKAARASLFRCAPDNSA